MTPEGHTLSAWITFSARRDGDVTVAQAQALERPSDPFDELAYMLGGNRQNNKFWQGDPAQPGGIVGRRRAGRRDPGHAASTATASGATGGTSATARRSAPPAGRSPPRSASSPAGGEAEDTEPRRAAVGHDGRRRPRSVRCPRAAIAARPRQPGGRDPDVRRPGPTCPASVFFVSYAGIGAYLVARRPTNSVGWLLLLTGWGLAIGSRPLHRPARDGCWPADSIPVEAVLGVGERLAAGALGAASASSGSRSSSRSGRLPSGRRPMAGHRLALGGVASRSRALFVVGPTITVTVAHDRRLGRRPEPARRSLPDARFWVARPGAGRALRRPCSLVLVGRARLARRALPARSPRHRAPAIPLAGGGDRARRGRDPDLGGHLDLASRAGRSARATVVCDSPSWSPTWPSRSPSPSRSSATGCTTSTGSSAGRSRTHW